jgi:hypothetical protein
MIQGSGGMSAHEVVTASSPDETAGRSDRAAPGDGQPQYLNSDSGAAVCVPP